MGDNPHLDTNVGDVTGHAHPSPPRDTNPTDMAERLVSDMVSSITLRGLSTDDVATASEFVFPRVRRSPPTDDTVQHLDVISCWKGLSRSQAIELKSWDLLFKEVLAVLIKQRVHQAITDELCGYSDPTNIALLVPRLIEYLSLEHNCLIKVDMTHLVRSILSRFYHDHNVEAASRNFPWSFGSRNLPSHVYNIVRTQDCFRHTLEGPCIFFDLHHSYVNGTLAMSIKVHWQLPRIVFPNLPRELSNGKIYRITPHLAKTSFGSTWSRDFTFFDDSPSYTVSNSSLPLQWDFTQGCYQAPVSYKPMLPLLSEEDSSQIAETELCARITTSFHAGVHFERISRYNIKLLMLHAPEDIVADISAGVDEQSNSSSITSHERILQDPPTPPDKTYPYLLHDIQPMLFKSNHWAQGNAYRYKITPPYRKDSMDVFSSEPKDAVRTHVTTICPASVESPRVLTGDIYNASQLSPGKRKASHPVPPPIDTSKLTALNSLEHLRLKAEAKRRKLEDSDDPDVHMDSDPDWKDLVWKAWYDEFTADLELLNRCSRSDSSATSVDEITPPVSAAGATRSVSVPLDQDEIRHNYEEFEERQKRKAEEKAYYAATVPGFDGVVSPTDVKTDKSFERIFLNDSELSD